MKLYQVRVAVCGLVTCADEIMMILAHHARSCCIWSIESVLDTDLRKTTKNIYFDSFVL
jgi:hypothetical protein